MNGYYILIGAITALSAGVSQRLKSKFAKYSNLHLQNNLSGQEIALKMLKAHGIHDVTVISVPGQLTDHYNPSAKTVNLSEVVFSQRNAAAAAVAAHEVGHAVQHATDYPFLTFRSQLVPLVGISSRFSQVLIFGGLALGALSSLGFGVAVVGLILMAVATLFSFVTLPVEYDASKRALTWLEKENLLSADEHGAASDALKWAARTYLVAALGSLANLLYFAFTILKSRRR